MSETADFFKDSGQEINFKKQALVFKEGDKSDSVFYIKKGKIEIFTPLEADRPKAVVAVPSAGRPLTGRARGRKVLAILKEGEMFGEMSLFEDSPRSAGAMALESSILLKVSKNKFHKFLQKEPEKAFVFTTEIIKIISQRLRIANSYLASLFSFSLSALRINNIEDLAALILDNVTSHIPGVNNCFLYIWNQFNEEFEYLQGRGKISFDRGVTFARYNESEITRRLAGTPSFIAPIGEDKILGFFYLFKKEALKEEEKVLLRTMLHLSSSLILGIWKQEEEKNLKRLRKEKIF